MTAVGDAAMEMIEEIRRQFREIEGLMEGNADPDHAKCIEIATNAALKKMILPGVIAVAMPAVVGFGLGAQSLGGMLAGALLGCVLLALMMANAGGAWDNAKKYIEKGNLGGKGSDVHAAAVVGDTVGGPVQGYIRTVYEHSDQCHGNRQSGDCATSLIQDYWLMGGKAGSFFLTSLFCNRT